MTVAIALDKKLLWRDINREERKKKRALLVELHGQIRDARARRKDALLAAKERCRSERIAARERARTLRLRALQELREAVEADRTAARQTCSVKIGEARAIRDDVERARAKHAAEKEYQRDLRRIEAANRQRRKEHPHATHIERRAESDDEIRSNLSAELVPLFDRVRRPIKATARTSRTEAFFAYVEEHPDEILHSIEDKTEALIREFERHRQTDQDVNTGYYYVMVGIADVKFGKLADTFKVLDIQPKIRNSNRAHTNLHTVCRRARVRIFSRDRERS